MRSIWASQRHRAGGGDDHCRRVAFDEDGKLVQIVKLLFADTNGTEIVELDGDLPPAHVGEVLSIDGASFTVVAIAREYLSAAESKVKVTVRKTNGKRRCP